MSVSRSLPLTPATSRCLRDDSGWQGSCDAGRGRPDCLRRVRPAFWKRDGRIPDSRKRRGCGRVVGHSDAIGRVGSIGRPLRRRPHEVLVLTSGPGTAEDGPDHDHGPQDRRLGQARGRVQGWRALPLARPSQRRPLLPASVAPSGEPVLGAVPGGELLPLHPHLRSRERVLSPVGPQRVRGGSNEDRPARCACAAGDRSSFLTMLYQNVSSP
jgi:hypothetical protein